MPSLVVRRLLVDLEAPFERRWAGGDAFRTAFFNALSMSFPLGEQFFIDAVRAGVCELDAEGRRRFAAEVQGFVGQEATHRRLHALFNAQLEAQGHDNAWARRIAARLKRLDGLDVRHPVAITAAYEHFTAVLAEHLLAHPEALDGAEPRLATLWLWHAAEESEHRSTAFDVYRALGGSERWRRAWFRRATFFFIVDLLRQLLANLRHDRALWHAATWREAGRFLFGRGHGVLRHTVRPWFAYLRADFHPSKQGGERGARWLREQAAQYAVVRG